MALQGSGEISLGDIGNEFGYTHGSETRLGSYRTTNGQGNFPVSFGALQFASIDAQTGGSVPTSGQIKFSDFYSTKIGIMQVVQMMLMSLEIIEQDLIIHHKQKFTFMSIKQ